MRACRVCARRGGGDERGEAGPLRLGREGTAATRAPRWGTRAGKPVRRGGRAAARARGGEGGAGKATGARSLTSHDTTHARARTVRPAGTSGPATGPTPSHASLPLSAPRASTRPPAAPQGELASAAEGHRGVPRAGAVAGAPGGAEGGGEGARRRRAGDAGSEPPRAPLRGARPRREPGQTSRARAARRRSQTGRRDPPLGERSAIEGRHAGVPREPRDQRTCPVRADVRVLSRTTHARNPETGAARPSRPPPLAPLLSPDLRAPGGGGVDEGGGRSCGGHGDRGGPSPPRPAPKHARASLFPTWIPADRPAGHDPGAWRVRPPPPLDAWTSRRVPHRARPGERRRRGNGRRERPPTRAARERERRSRGEREDPRERGRAGVRGTRAGARPPRDRHRRRRPHTSELGETEGPRGGPANKLPAARHPLSRGGERGRRLIVKRRSDRRSPGRNPGPQVRSKCR